MRFVSFGDFIIWRNFDAMSVEYVELRSVLVLFSLFWSYGLGACFCAPLITSKHNNENNVSVSVCVVHLPNAQKKM